jgi:IS605 OrfB family transposase
MYNETIKFIKDNYIYFKNEFDNFINTQLFIDFLEIKKNKILIETIIRNADKKIKDSDKNKKLDDITKESLINLINSEEKKLILIKTIYEEKKTYIDKFLKNKPYSIVKNKFKLNYQNIRTYFLKDIRDNIIKNCTNIKINKNISIKTHILDATIKLACSNYQSAITNFENGNIKTFRIRYWKKKRDKRVLEIEKSYFRNNPLCYSIFNKIKGFFRKGKKYYEFNFDDIEGSAKLHYNKKTNEYNLYVTKKVENNILELEKSEIIGIDLGLRTFSTCLTKNEVIDIGNIKNSRLESLIKKKIRLMNFNNNKKTRKYKESVNKRIKGLIDELHWKSIKFLTDNYKTILIGDLSTKGIVCSSTSVLKKYNKELAYALSFYKYRERLKYKCLINNSNYINVNERYTSKVCSVCGEFKDNLGSSKIYKCKNCMSTLDRDVNSCRNIILKCS